MKKFILAIFILYLPFQLVLPKIPVINTINFFLIVLAFVFIFGRNPEAVRSKFDTPLLIFLVIWFLSFMHTLFAYPPGIWRVEVTVEFKRLITLVLAYFVIARCIKTKKELRFLFFVFLLSIVLVAIHTWRNGMLAGPNFADFKRSSGPFGIGWEGADIAGGFLAIFTPFVLSYALLNKKMLPRFIAFAGVGICLMGLFATYSRGSILAFVIASFVTVVVSAKHIFKASKLSALIILIIFTGLAFGWKHWVPESIINRTEGTFEQQVFQPGLYSLDEKLSVDVAAFDESSQGRIDKWRAGLEIFRINPFVGVGFRIPQYILSYDTHNAFILILAEMGMLGILAFMWFLWKIFREGTLLLNTEFAIIGVSFIGCIAAFIVVNMFYSNFFRDTVAGTFWIALGLLAASKKYAISPAGNKLSNNE